MWKTTILTVEEQTNHCKRREGDEGWQQLRKCRLPAVFARGEDQITVGLLPEVQKCEPKAKEDLKKGAVMNAPCTQVSSTPRLEWTTDSFKQSGIS